MSKPNIKPIFLFSLPRSGSTLLQKVIMTNEKIDSISEPWILLPFIYNIRKKGTLAEYSHINSFKAVNNIIDKIGGKEQYFKYVKNMSKKMYSSIANNNSLYFLDKTPRYHLIIPEIVNNFPDAKFIFLFRHPLAIYSSILKTWHRNRFLTIYKNHIDLYEGVYNLVNGYKMAKNKSIKIVYKDLILNKKEVIYKISNYLNLDRKKFDLNYYKKQNLDGEMGDNSGINKYNTISNRSIGKWKSTFNSYYRKRIAIKYLKYLNNDFFKMLDTNRENIINEVNKIETKKIGIKDFLEYKFSKYYKEIKIKFQTQDLLELFNKTDENNLYF
mgnify:CR=1 FL=1